MPRSSSLGRGGSCEKRTGGGMTTCSSAPQRHSTATPSAGKFFRSVVDWRHSDVVRGACGPVIAGSVGVCSGTLRQEYFDGQSTPGPPRIRARGGRDGWPPPDLGAERQTRPFDSGADDSGRREDSRTTPAAKHPGETRQRQGNSEDLRIKYPRRVRESKSEDPRFAGERERQR